jgi:hypothetical protein
MAMSLVVVIPYFGRWPEWIDFFVESCRWNPDITWLMPTDCGPPANTAPNVRFVPTSFADYCARVSGRLGIRFQPSSAYKLCDLKPALGHVHADEIAGFSHWAYGDVDVIYGRLRRFLTDAMAERYRVISSHDTRLAGHLSVFRNDERLRQAFRRIPNWQRQLEFDGHSRMDESKFTRVVWWSRRLKPPLRDIVRHLDPGWRRSSFTEWYTTILSPRPWHDGRPDHPERWFWRQGRLTNDRDGDREFPYLHFMNWKSNRYLRIVPEGTPSAWMTLDRIVSADWRRAGADGFEICRGGIVPLEGPAAQAGSSTTGLFSK